MSNRANVYTSVASSMVSNTEILTAKLAKEPLGTARRVLKVTAPVGPSSSQGALSRQSLTLSANGQDPVCGWVDFVAQAGEVKDYFATGAAFEARYRTPFDVTEAEYRNWSAKLLAALRELGVKAVVVGDDAHYAPTDPAVARRGTNSGVAPATEEADEPRGPSLVPVVIGALLAGLGLTLAVWLVIR
ncbi:MAG: hypothetical protein U0228_09895 [Myxococcaceae bacterium]